MGSRDQKIGYIPGGAEPSTRRLSLLWLFGPVVSWAVGLLVMAWPTFASGFQRVQGGLGDSRLVNFTLEHSYRWLMGMPLAEDLWSPPIFFPVQNVAAYTDLMLGVAPLYWIWRWFGCDPHTAYQLWMLICWSLNFAACFLVLHRGLRLHPFGASAGAYLFAFASPRYMSMAHQQLVPQFWLVAALAGLIAIFKGGERLSRVGRWIASAALWFGLVAQLYTAVYPLAFFALGLAAAAAAGLTVRSMREPLLAAVKRHAIPLTVTAVIAVAMSVPLAANYSAAAADLGMHSENQVHLPKPLSWVLPGNSSRVYGKMLKTLDLPGYRGFSQTNGVGFATLVACAVGLWIGRRRRVVQLMVVGIGALVLVTLSFPGGWSPWWVVRELVPGAAALRAVARVGLMLLFPAAFGLALVTDALVARRRWIAAAVVILVVIAEQPHRRPSFDKAAAMARVDSIAAKVPARSETFLLVFVGPSWDKYLHDDAAWAAIATGIPTVNGRYGHFPPGYPFKTPWIQRPSDMVDIRANLEVWTGERGVAIERSAIVRAAPRPPKKRRLPASPGPQVESQD